MNIPQPPSVSGFAGWLAFGSEKSEPRSPAESLSSVIDTRLPTHVSEESNLGLASTTAISHTLGTLTCGIIGNPIWEDEDTRSIAASAGDSQALFTAYQKYGTQLTKILSGSFALAVLDPTLELAFLATDRMGRFPIYYHCDNNGLVFGSSARSVLSLLGEMKPLSPQGIYEYMYFHMVPSPGSIFEGLQKLQAGSTAKCSREGAMVHHHWIPSFSESQAMSRIEAEASLKKALRTAVDACTPPTGKVGAFLSGGLDSTTVTGMLAEISEGPCDAYSIGFAAEGYDEMEYARLSAKHFGVRLHEYYVTPQDVVEALPLIANSYDEPFGNSSALPAYFCARMAADDGVSVLLAGDGGDEIFAGNERYLKQRMFENYYKAPQWLRAGFIEPVTRSLPDWFPLAAKARSYISQAHIPLPDRLQSYNFMHRTEVSEVFQPNFYHSLEKEQPLILQRTIYNTPEQASQLNRMLYLDWQYTLADNDLRKVSHMCAVAGVEVAYPMLEDSLVELSTRIPSAWKMQGNNLRDFYKNTLQGWLPDETLSKSKQGFGLPFGVWMHTYKPLQEIAYDSIESLKSRHIFNPAFLDNTIRLHREEHAAYYGELIWILTILGLWLESHHKT